jgi:hypothetical protein
MTDLTPPHPPHRAPGIIGTVFDFTPVPTARTRRDGWSAEVQRGFIHALSVMGSVGPACRAVGMGRVSAYRLREREATESYAAAWDAAVHAGRWRQYDVAMERAVNGVTTVRVLKGGSVSISGGADMRVLNAALRETPIPPAPRNEG